MSQEPSDKQITVTCPGCGFQATVPAETWGRTVRCRECKTTFAAGELPAGRRQPAPDGLVFSVYGATGTSIVLLLFPFVWMFSVPLAAFALVGSWYISGRYKRTPTILACALASIVVLFVCLMMLSEASYQARKAEW